MDSRLQLLIGTSCSNSQLTTRTIGSFLWEVIPEYTRCNSSTDTSSRVHWLERHFGYLPLQPISCATFRGEMQREFVQNQAPTRWSLLWNLRISKNIWVFQAHPPMLGDSGLSIRFRQTEPRYCYTSLVWSLVSSPLKAQSHRIKYRILELFTFFEKT